MDLTDLDFTIGDPNASGINDTIYCIPKAKISSWPVIIDKLGEADSTEEYVQFAGDFVFAEGAKCFKLYNTEGKGKLTFEPTGDLDVMEYTNKANFQYPSLKNQGRAFAKRGLNDDLVYFVHHDGQWFVIGDKFYRVKTSIAGDSGDGAGSKTGITISLECRSNTPLPTYAGALPITGGTYDCDTDTFEPDASSGSGSGSGSGS